MAMVVGDRVRETATSTGAVIALLGAVAKHRAFSVICAVSDYVRITRIHQTVAEWETGLYRYTNANELTRAQFEASSSGAAMTFSAGTQNVFCEHVAAKAVLPAIPDVIMSSIQLQDESIAKPGVFEMGTGAVLEVAGTSIVEAL